MNNNQPKTKEFLLKNKECSSIKGKLYQGNFYHCEHTTIPNYSLCEHCSINCHKSHSDKHDFLPSGDYECYCCIDQHQTVFNKDPSFEKNCFYEGMVKEVESLGFYSITENNTTNIYCCICFEFCMKKNISKEETKVTNKMEQRCDCLHHSSLSSCQIMCKLSDHYSGNIWKKDSFKPKYPTFPSYIGGFNFNIFIKNPKTNEVTMKYVYETLKNLNDLSHDYKKELNNPYFQYALQFFMAVSQEWKFKGYYLNKVTDFDLFPKAFKLINQKPNFDYSPVALYNHYQTQIYLLFLLNNMYIRESYITKNNQWILQTIQNMNIYQRFKYLHKVDLGIGKAFSTKGTTEERNRQQMIITAIIKRYTQFFRDFESNSYYQEKGMLFIFPCFLKVMKFAIKYCLANEESINYFFQIINDTLEKNKHLSIWELPELSKNSPVKTMNNKVAPTQEQKNENILDKKSSYLSKIRSKTPVFIIKSLFYYLLYANDKYTMEKMNKKFINKHKDTNFIFSEQANKEDNQTLEIVKSIFYNCIRMKNLLYEGNRICNRILELMTQNNSFYVVSLNNLKLLPELPINYLTIKSPYADSINIFVNEILKLSKDYYSYQLPIEDYSIKINTIVMNFREFIIKHFTLDDLSIEYLSFFKGIETNEKIKESLFLLKLDIKNSMFYQALENIIIIIGSSEDFQIEKNMINEESGSSLFTKESKKFILQFLFLLISNDMENFCLVMNLEAFKFTSFFYCIQDILLCYFNRIIETLYSSSYFFGNIFFIEKTITKWLTYIAHLKRKIQVYYPLITQLFKMTSLIFNRIYNPYNLDIAILSQVEMASFKGHHDVCKNLFVAYFEENIDEITKAGLKHETIGNLVVNYYEMSSRFESMDTSRYQHNNDVVTDNFMDYKSILILFNKIISGPFNERKIDIKLIYPMLYYYIQRTLPFRINPVTGNQVISNMIEDFTLNEEVLSRNTISNSSLIYLFRKDNVENDQSKQIEAQLQDLFEKMDFIVLIAKNYEKILKDYSQERNSFPSLLQLKITSYLFIQNVLLKPSHYFIKALEIYLPYVTGIMFSHVREMIFYLFKAIEYFYLNTSLFDDKDNIQSQSIKTNAQFKEYIDIEIQLDLSRNDLNDIHQAIDEMASLKYFMIDKYIKKYEELINKVFIREKQTIKKKSNFNEKIDDLVDIYVTEINKGSQFIKFKSGALDLDIFKIKNFELRNIHTDNFQFEKLSKILYLTAIIQSAIEVVNKKEDIIAFNEILKKCADKDNISYLLTVITFSTIQEMISMFYLRNNDKLKGISLHASFVSIFIKYLQILCEGNNIIMKEYLFNVQYSPIKLNIIIKAKSINPLTANKLTEETEKEPSKKLLSNQLVTSSNSKEGKKENDDLQTKANITQTKKPKQALGIGLINKTVNKEQEMLKSFLNIICSNMKIIHHTSTNNMMQSFTPSLLSETKLILYRNSNLIYSNYKDLLIEMIQGYTFTTDIFSRLSLENQAPFAFYYLCENIHNLILNKKTSLELICIEQKIDFLVILINIINQKHSFDQNTNFLQIFNIFELSNLLVFYIKYIYLYYCEKITPDNNQYQAKSQELLFDTKSLKKMMNCYKKNEEITKDKIFELSQNLYFLIKLLGEKCKIILASKFIAHGKIPFDSDETTKKEPIGINIIDKEKEEYARKLLSAKIFLCKFYNKIIKKVELYIFSEGQEVEIKHVYFLLEPKTYLIDNQEIDTILENADRTSRLTKLKSVVDSIPNLVNRINYKTNHDSHKPNTWLTKFSHFNYSHIDLFNCIFAVLINVTYLEMLDQTEYSSQLLTFVSLILESTLIFINGLFLVIFIITKYPLYLHLNMSNYHKNREQNILNWLYVVIFESFIFNKEIKMMIIVTSIGLFGIITPYDIILFTLQLLTIAAFIPTIQDIMNAFVMRFDQFFAMISFLAIFVFFYANYGFFSLRDQYTAELEGGVVLNSCTSLLECFITLFSNGVRSGGGIGDVLGESNYTDAGYWERYAHDTIFYIVVILFLLNMINGIVVGTFSQLREENNAKEEDKTNICYICSIPVFELEKRRNTFKNHYRNEHNVKTYVRYLANLYLRNSNELDQDQYYVYNCLNQNNYEFFPLFKDESED